MTESKKTKRELTASVISIVLCVVMLVGLTFAWFTDSVTNKGNIIKSGNLDVAFEWANGTEALETAVWKDASGDAIFNYDKWEPGYTEARHVRISNKGNLALKYEVKIEPNGEVSKLAEVIDVYYIEGGQQLANRTDLTNAKKIGTLKELLDNPYVAKGHILAGGNADVATIALKMQESADNEYQNLSIGSDFSVKLVATQYTSENDSFGNDYDESAVWPIEVKNDEELVEALTAGGTVELTQDITIASGAMNLPVIDKDTTIRLGSHTLNVTGVGTAQRQKILVNNGATLTIDGEEKGKITYEGADTSPRLFSVENGSKLVINGGDFVITKTNDRNDGQGVYLDEGCTFEMNGGSITANKGTALNISGKNCKVVINDGTLLSNNGNNTVMMSAGSTLEMNGGEVIMENDTNKFSYAFSGSMNAGKIVINDGRVAGPIAFNLGKNQKVTVNGGTIESARLNYTLNSGTLLTVNDGRIIGTGTDDGGEPAVVLDKGNVELRGGTYSPNYLYARNGANVTVFAAVYNGENPPAYGSDDASTIMFG